MTSYAKKTDTVSFLSPIPQRKLRAQLRRSSFDAVYVYYINNLDATRGCLHYSPGDFAHAFLL